MNNSTDLTFFLGAGASAPFNIPTMKKLVVDFEKMLKEDGSVDELSFFKDIKDTLEKILKRPVDLEDIFTVIDGIINFGLDRLGLLSIYTSMKSFSKIPSINVSINMCITLRDKFRNFIRKACMIPEKAYPEIYAVYGDLFTKITESSSSSSSAIHRREGGISYCTTWTIFTTNYDTCLEYFWRERAKVSAPLNTGFRYNETRRIHISEPRIFSELSSRGEYVHYIKLHGSLNWLLEPDGTVTEQESIQSQSFLGRRYEGPMMIYPIQQKELWVEPFISMFSFLNTKLREKSNWIIIGYSFNDPIIREIFLKNSNDNKNIILLHPHADEIFKKYLKNIKGTKHQLKNYFGQHESYQNINQEIVDCLN